MRPRGSLPSEFAVLVYSDARLDIQPVLKKPKLGVLKKACGKLLSPRELIELRSGRAKKPHRKTRELLVGILKELGSL